MDGLIIIVTFELKRVTHSIKEMPTKQLRWLEAELYISATT